VRIQVFLEGRVHSVAGSKVLVNYNNMGEMCALLSACLLRMYNHSREGDRLAEKGTM
jgi:hypothetical protein